MRKQMIRYFCQESLFSNNNNISAETIENLKKHGYTNMTNI